MTNEEQSGGGKPRYFSKSPFKKNEAPPQTEADENIAKLLNGFNLVASVRQNPNLQAIHTRTYGISTGRTEGKETTSFLHLSNPRAEWSIYDSSGRTYDFQINYGIAKDVLMLKKTVIRVSDSNDEQFDSAERSASKVGYGICEPYSQARLALEFQKEQAVQKVMLSWLGLQAHTVLSLAGDSFLSQFIRKHFYVLNPNQGIEPPDVYRRSRQAMQAIIIDFSKEIPTISLYQKASIPAGHTEKDGLIAPDTLDQRELVNSAFSYDKTRDLFVKPSYFSDNPKRLITSADSIALMKSIMELIPPLQDVDA